MGVIVHLSIVIFPLRKQVRTGLLPTVITNTEELFPEEKKRECVRGSLGVVVWTSQGNVCSATNKREAMAVLICTLSVISSYSCGLWIQWSVTANPCNTNFPLRIILVDKTGYWSRTLLLPIVFSGSASKGCACVSKSSSGLLTGPKIQDVASGHMTVVFLSNCCCQQNKQLLLLHSCEIQHSGQRPCLHLSGITQVHITLVELCVGGKDFASCLRVFLHVH